MMRFCIPPCPCSQILGGCCCRYVLLLLSDPLTRSIDSLEHLSTISWRSLSKRPFLPKQKSRPANAALWTGHFVSVDEAGLNSCNALTRMTSINDRPLALYVMVSSVRHNPQTVYFRSLLSLFTREKCSTPSNKPPSWFVGPSFSRPQCNARGPSRNPIQRHWTAAKISNDASNTRAILRFCILHSDCE